MIVDSPISLKLGLSGVMRVKNEELCLRASISSVIDQVDELIITYNDCTDKSADIINEFSDKYPDKIKAFSYPYNVFGVYCDKEEYDYAKSLQANSPNLLSSYSNYGLSKISYQYAVKLDADQVYFKDKISRLRSMIVKDGYLLEPLYTFLGRQVYNRFFHLDVLNPKHYVKLFLRRFFHPLLKRLYLHYCVDEFRRGNAYLALSGIDSFIRGGKWCSPLACIKNVDEIWEPYNGEGDLFLFKVTGDEFFVPKDRGIVHGKYCFLESFCCPNRNMLFCGFYWYHLKPQKEPFNTILLEQGKQNDAVIVETKQLAEMSFREICVRGKLCEWKRYVYGFATDMDRRLIRKVSKQLDMYNLGQHKA